MDFRRSIRHARQVSVEQRSGAGCCGWVLVAGAMCSVAMLVILAVAIIAVGIAKLVMGGLYFHDCDLQPLLPIFLIVDASVAFVLGCKCQCRCGGSSSGSGGAGGEEEGDSVWTKVLKVFVGLFQFAWLICGTLWVVQVRDVIYSPDHPCPPLTTTTTTITTTSATTDPTSTTAPPVATTEGALNGSSFSGSSSILLSALASSPSASAARCLTCAPALVDFTFGIVIFQWLVIGVVLLNICFFIIGACCVRRN